MAGNGQKKIIGSHIYRMHTCEHAVYLEFFGDPARKIAPDDSLKLLFERGNRHEAEIAEVLAYPEPTYEIPDWDSGFASTQDLMRVGENGVYQAVLLDEKYLGKPDLLRRVDSPSSLGDWSYIVGDVKSSKKIKLEQVMQVCFYSMLLEQVQEVRPEKGFIVLGDGSEEEFSIDDYYWTLLDLLDELDEILAGERTTDYQISTQCEGCAWSEYCRENAEATRDISLIYGLTKAHKRLLVPNGITTIQEASKLDVESLKKIKGLGEGGLKKIKRQADVLARGKAQWIGKPRIDSSALEIYFDMESDPYSETEYLFGLLLVRGPQEELKYFVAQAPDDEKSAFLEFMDFMQAILASNPECRIYHYHHYEPKHVEKLVDKHGRAEMLKDLQDHMIDLLPVIKKNVVLPLPSYSLKYVARHLGFEWRGEEASAAQSVVWYNNYLADGNQEWLDLIIEYNQDDLIATKVVKEWLQTRS